MPTALQACVEVETSPLALMRFAASTFNIISGRTSLLTITRLEFLSLKKVHLRHTTVFVVHTNIPLFFLFVKGNRDNFLLILKYLLKMAV
jgi:phosphatidylserine synthase